VSVTTEAAAATTPATAASPAVIAARDLVKTYGEVEAVRGVDFEVPLARCIGLLGPNGAGKTTTMRMIMGLTTLTRGRLELFGVPVDRIGRAERARIGLVPQDNNLDPDLSVRQNLETYGRYYGLTPETVARRVPELLDFVQLREKTDARVYELSGGMRRRLVIARALIADPELLILDEPTTGLDPQARVMIWRALLDLRKRGKTLLLTTHYMDEAQRLCDDVIIIDQGLILDRAPPDGLIARHVQGHVFEVAKPLPAGLDVSGLESEDIGDALLFYVADPAEARARLLAANAPYLHRPANLEDVFLRLTGRKLREGA
jgi:lipooligosaccharide transport system ATP-binding protein